MVSLILPVGAWHVSPNGTWQGHKDRRPPSVNPGVDYECVVNTPVRAAHDGVVRYAQSTYAGSGGRLIYLRLQTGGVRYLETQYLHLERVLVKNGDPVKQGDIIAYSGASGFGRSRYYGPHCHVSAIVDGINVNFAQLVAGATQWVEVDQFKPLIDETVRLAQRILRALEFPVGVADGIMGKRTEEQVTLYQQMSGLTADGVVGPKTIARLKEDEMALADIEKKVSFIYDAIKNGGPDMPDSGKSIGKSLAELRGRFMRISAPGKPTALAAPGYWRELHPGEEEENAGALVAYDVRGNARQWDLWKSMCLAGQAANQVSPVVTGPSTQAADEIVTSFRRALHEATAG